MTTRAFFSRALVLPTGLAVAVGLVAGCGSDDTGTGHPEASHAATRAVSADPAGLTVSADGTEVSYNGVTGKTALELLRQLDPSAAADGDGANAFVTTIKGHKANQAKNEFWAFYVNGAQAQVGAGSYVTKDGEVITWKLETF